MTTSIEKDRKRIRILPRGILTPNERERLERGLLNRHMKHNIKLKTEHTLIVDLPLIFERIDFPDYEVGKSHYLALIKLYFNLVKSHMRDLRAKSGVKRKVSDEMVWRQIKKEVESAYKNGVYQH